MFGIRIVHGAPLTDGGTDGRRDEVDGGGVLSAESLSVRSRGSACCVVGAAGHSIQYRDCTSVGRSSKKRRGEGGMHPPLIPLTPLSVCCSSVQSFFRNWADYRRRPPLAVL